MKRLFVLIIAVCVLMPLTHAQVQPEEALKKLAEGNKRYLTNELKKKNFEAQRDEQRKGQHPYAIILTCADSRVPPEIIFDEDLGELFVIRVAGNVIDEVTLGSIEYAAEHLHVQLCVVLGHSSCGAVKATLEGGDFGKNINALAGKIKPAVDAAKGKSKDKNLILPLAVEGNAELQAENCINESEIIKELMHENKFKVMCGIYSIENGGVSFFEPEHKGEGKHELKKEIEKPKSQKHSEPEKKHKESETKSDGHSTGYNFENDLNVQGNIFTDGKQFCLQLSSWKTKTKAEREASKIKEKKDNVFVMPFTHPETNQNWYRVRVGSFQTVSETENFLTLLK